MDETTSIIDIKTEEKIQHIFNKYYIDLLLLLLLIQLKLLLIRNKILVLDNGQNKEFDKPKILLQNQKSLFYQLYNKSSI